jgi:DNA-binding NarL/FixJ family response regulator
MNVLIIDDHKIVAEGIKMLVQQSSKVHFVASITSPKMVIPFLNSHKIDLIITDLNMPEMDGIELIEKIQPQFPYIQFGVLSMYYNQRTISQLINLNVSFCLNKNVELAELELALDSSLKKQTYIQENLRESFGDNDYLPFKNSEDIRYSFTSRELEVYKLIMKSHKSAEIAEIMFVTINTIKAHRKSILKKTECSSIQELILLGIKMGFKTE